MDSSAATLPLGLDSRSLVTLLKDESTGWDDESISQFGRHNLMIKRGTLKYQSYGAEMPEVLFDLGRHPAEVVDFADHQDYQECMTLFRRRRAELGYEPMVSA